MHRREFLQEMGGAAMLLATGKHISPNDTIRVGVIGMGSWDLMMWLPL